jgi:hypothetical protein
MWEVASPFLGSFVAVLGALLVFNLETRRTRAEEQRRRDRELVGLMLLVYAELSMNRELMKKYYENWKYFWALPEHPTSDVWDEAKVRVVELAPPALSGPLISYYRLLRALIVYVDKEPAEMDEGGFVAYVRTCWKAATGRGARRRHHRRVRSKVRQKTSRTGPG